MLRSGCNCADLRLKETNVHFIFAPILNRYQLLKEIIYSPGRTSLSEKETGKHESCIIYINGRKMGVITERNN